MKYILLLISLSLSIYSAAQESQSQLKAIENKPLIPAISAQRPKIDGLQSLIAGHITHTPLQAIIASYVGSFDCKFVGKINTKIIPLSAHHGNHNSFDHFLHFDEERNWLKGVVLDTQKTCLKKWNLLTGQEMNSCFVISSQCTPDDIFSNFFTTDGQYVVGIQQNEIANGTLPGISCKKDENNNMIFAIDPLYNSDDIKRQFIPGERLISCVSNDANFVFNFFSAAVFNLISLENNAEIFRFQRSQLLSEQIKKGEVNEAYRITALALSEYGMAAVFIAPPIGSNFTLDNNATPITTCNAYVAIYFVRLHKKIIITIPGDCFSSLNSDAQLRFTSDSNYLEVRADNQRLYWQINIRTRAVEQKQDIFCGKFNTYSLDGTYRAMVVDNKVVVIHIKSNTCKIIHIPDNGTIEQLALSKTGKYIAVGVKDTKHINQGIYVFKTVDVTNPESENNAQSNSDWEYNLVKNSLSQAVGADLAKHIACIGEYASMKPYISAEFEITDTSMEAIRQELARTNRLPHKNK